MPIQGAYGALSARAWGRLNAYVPPVMRTVGTAPGTVARNTKGYLLSAWHGSTMDFAYLDRPLSSGKWYWEYKYVSDPSHGQMTGVVKSSNLGGGFTWLGYDLENAGFYSVGANVWNSLDTVLPAHSALPIPVTGDVVGFALDMTSGSPSLDMFVNNAAVTSSLSMTWTGAYTFYAGFAFQDTSGTAAGQVQLGLGHTTYAPPAGYKYL